MKKILEFYTKVLVSLGLVVEDNGLISKKIGGNKTPMEIKHKDSELRLTMPTQAFLDNPDWENLIPFHPISENIVKGESVIIKELRKVAELRIADVVTTLMMTLTEIASDKSSHKKLSVPMKEFLKHMPEANEKTITTLSKMIYSLSNSGDRKICSFYIKRGGSINGTPFKRVSVVNFPFMEELCKDEKEVYGVKVTAADKLAIKKLFDYLLPNSEINGNYNFGSNDNVAPNFHALMSSFYNIMNLLNAKIELFKKYDEVSDLLVEAEYDVELNNLDDFQDIIPHLNYNDGDEAKVDNSNRISANQINNMQTVNPNNFMQQQPQFQQPMMNMNNSIPTETPEGKISWNSVFPNNNTGMYNQPQTIQTGSGRIEGVQSQFNFQQPNMQMNNFNGYSGI